MADWTPDEECAGRLAFNRWCRDQGMRGRIVPWDWADMSAFEKRDWMNRAKQAAARQIS